MRPVRRIVLAALLTLALLATACASTGDPSGAEGGTPARGEDPGPGGTALERPPTTVRVGLGRDPASLDPRNVADDEGELVVRALFDGLVDVAPDGSTVPNAATWELEDEGLTYRFLLRKDRFHDGTEVTAQHHADALLAVLDPDRAPRFREALLGPLRGATRAGEDSTGAPAVRTPEPEAGGGDDVDGADVSTAVDDRWGRPEDVIAAGGIEVVGPRELILRLERPDPLLLYRLADPVLVPLPRIAHDDPSRFALEPVGNGPFRMVGPREPGAFIRLARFADHPAPAAVDALVLQIYPDDADRSQRWSDLVTGRLQIAAVPSARRDEARERFGEVVRPGVGAGLHDAPLASLYAYGFTLDVAPYDDPDLRRAISAAIDRDALAATLAPAGVEPATSILPAVVGGVPVACPHCRFDPVVAAEAVAAWRARLPVGAVEPRIVLNYPRGPAHVTIAEHVASDIERALGVEVRLQVREFGALVRAIEAGDAPFFRYGLRAELGGRAAAISLLDPAFRRDGGGGWVRWSDGRTDGALDRWDASAPPDLLREVEGLVLDAAAVIPLLWTRADLVVHPDLVGFRMDVTGRWWPERLRIG